MRIILWAVQGAAIATVAAALIQLFFTMAGYSSTRAGVIILELAAAGWAGTALWALSVIRMLTGQVNNLVQHSEQLLACQRAIVQGRENAEHN